MAGETVRIESVHPSVPGYSASNPMYTATGTAAPAAPYYAYTLIEAAGTAASNNYLSLFNPVGSGKNLNVVRFIFSPWASGATTTTRSMTVQKITAASGGTVVATNTIPKFSSSSADSVADLRTGNPTVTTTGIPMLGVPPAVSTAGAGVTAVTTILAPLGVPRILAPGEGIVFNVAAGTTGQLWNLNVTWYEL